MMLNKEQIEELRTYAYDAMLKTPDDDTLHNCLIGLLEGLRIATMDDEEIAYNYCKAFIDECVKEAN